MSEGGEELGLAPFADALRERLEDELADALPDLVEVVEAAHLADPEAVSATMVDETKALPAVVRLPRRRGEAALGDFVDALEARTDASLRERGLSSIPPLQTPRRRSGARVAVGLGIAAAIALVVAALSPALLSGGGGVSGGMEAQRIADEGPSRSAPIVGPTITTANARRDMYDGSLSPEAAGADAAAPAGDGSDPPEGDEAPAAETREVSTNPAPRGDGGRGRGEGTESLAALDARAQAAWQRGELVEAERLLLLVIERGGRSSRAELAYGDIFMIAHQRGRADRERRYWRAYLKTFPRGRFADDARAGLCRAQSGELARACWRRYLESEPRGSHRGEAEAAIGDGRGGR